MWLLAMAAVYVGWPRWPPSGLPRWANMHGCEIAEAQWTFPGDPQLHPTSLQTPHSSLPPSGFNMQPPPATPSSPPLPQAPFWPPHQHFWAPNEHRPRIHYANGAYIGGAGGR